MGVELALHYLLEALPNHSADFPDIPKLTGHLQIDSVAGKFPSALPQEKIKLMDFVGETTESIGAQYLADIGFSLCYSLEFLVTL